MNLTWFNTISYVAIIVATNIYQCEAENDTQIWKLQQFQNFYMSTIVDVLEPLEELKDCACPRIYLPICGTDNRTYTNICKMNCVNNFRREQRKSNVSYVGICTQFGDHYEY